MNFRNCKMCGQPIGENKRSSAQFCGATCRKRWSRRPDMINDAHGKILYELGQIRHAIKLYPDLRDHANKQLKDLREQIDFLLSLHDRETIQRMNDRNDLLLRAQRPAGNGRAAADPDNMPIRGRPQPAPEPSLDVFESLLHEIAEHHPTPDESWVVQALRDKIDNA